MPRFRTLLGAAALFWALFGLVCGTQTWVSMITHGHSLPRLVGYHVLIWEGWLLPTALIFVLARRFPLVPPRRLNVLVHVLAASVVSVLHGFFWMALLLWMKPFDRMTSSAAELPVAELLFARLPLEWILYCLVLGAAAAIEYYGRFRERELASAQLEGSLADARLRALELQLQPHFLFNTLNAISSLVRNRRNDEAVTMVAGLSELLRYSLDHAGEQRVALEQEIGVVRRYLEIQQSRFSDRLTWTIDVTPEAWGATVPTLLLQPLAENAVTHGIAPSAAAGVIDVRAFRTEGELQIEVFNSGSLSSEPREGVGLRNTRERLAHLYGDRCRFDLRGDRGGVLVSIAIPWLESRKGLDVP